MPPTPIHKFSPFLQGLAPRRLVAIVVSMVSVFVVGGLGLMAYVEGLDPEAPLFQITLWGIAYLTTIAFGILALMNAFIGMRFLFLLLWPSQATRTRNPPSEHGVEPIVVLRSIALSALVVFSTCIVWWALTSWLVPWK